LDRPARSSHLWQRAKAAAEQHPDSRYEAFRDALRATIPYVWRRRTVMLFQSRFGLLKLRKWLQRQVSSYWPFRTNRRLIPRDFYEGLTLLPYPSTREIKAILNRPVPPGPIGIADGQPKASIIVITYNNLVLTRLCLESVLRNTGYPAYEVIVVDNDSRDGTRQYLESLASCHSHVSIILNDDNLGFPKANNQGISRAAGEYIVLLNNDTVVPRAWLSRLLRHLEDPEVGLVGPGTNSVGNEARLPVSYASWVEMEDFARRRGWDYHRKNTDIAMLAMFCVAMRRSVYDRVGPLDEQFGVGMFEDDDYSMRVRAAGLRVVCAADVFVHHFGQAACGKLIESGHYDAIYDENRRRYEAKWGPHSSRAQSTTRPEAD
jgi:GT2 family glycosyltransferase